MPVIGIVYIHGNSRILSSLTVLVVGSSIGRAPWPLLALLPRAASAGALALRFEMTTYWFPPGRLDTLVVLDLDTPINLLGWAAS